DGISNSLSHRNFARAGATRNDCFAIREVAQRKHPKGWNLRFFLVATFLADGISNSLSPRNFDIVILINLALQGIADSTGQRTKKQAEPV
ncbi:hypothetical protein J7L68_01860, partial [bacterium]|nr:hypothetical protein [bacterium]